MRRGIIGCGLAIACAIVVAAQRGGGQSCAGDCGGDGQVTISDLITGVGIALGSEPVSRCRAMDTNDDGAVTVDELIRAVTVALGGCVPSTITPTSPATTTA